MKYLCDAHIFIWWMEQDRRLKEEIKLILEDPKNIIYLSVVCIWEMVIKTKIKKLHLPTNWKETITDSRFEILPIDLKHVLTVESLPDYHKDPFDRMLISQSISEGATLITGDKKIWRYNLPVIKA